MELHIYGEVLQMQLLTHGGHHQLLVQHIFDDGDALAKLSGDVRVVVADDHLLGSTDEKTTPVCGS